MENFPSTSDEAIARMVSSLPASLADRKLNTNTAATVDNRFQTFAPFPRLPKEMQIKIWTHALEPPRAVPRVVRVTHQESTNTFSYSVSIPPVLEVSRLARETAKAFYPSLIADSTYPIYINPNKDFLYCKTSLDPLSVTPYARDPPDLPFIDSKADVSTVRYLILDSEYFEHRDSRSPDNACSIEEMRNFRSIEKLYLVEPALEQWLESTRRLNVRLSAIFPLPENDLGRQYAAEIARDRVASNSEVPGFRMGRKIDIILNARISRCFGIPQNLRPGIINIGQGSTLPVDGRYWIKIPEVVCVRA